MALAVSADAHAALQKLAGYEKSSDNRFGSLYSYLANLRDALLPLAIPVSTIGLVVVGGMYMPLSVPALTGAGRNRAPRATRRVWIPPRRGRLGTHARGKAARRR